MDGSIELVACDESGRSLPDGSSALERSRPSAPARTVSAVSTDRPRTMYRIRRASPRLQRAHSRLMTRHRYVSNVLSERNIRKTRSSSRIKSSRTSWAKSWRAGWRRRYRLQTRAITRSITSRCAKYRLAAMLLPAVDKGARNRILRPWNFQVNARPLPPSKLVRNVPILSSIEMSPGLLFSARQSFAHGVALIALRPAPRMVVGEGASACRRRPWRGRYAGKNAGRPAAPSTRATSSGARDTRSPVAHHALHRP